MASVVFSTVGQALGGPLGAAVGAAVGGTIDGALFGRRRAGASDLMVQRSAYGEALPRLYGTTRAAGILVWAQPMATGGGKGSGRRSQSTSLAIALSSGPIRSIGRVWADGREVRGADGQFETATDMRVYTGSGRQSPDPIIVAAEGVGRAPAYQGLAYVVFENLDLAPFGNRIPNFTFEVDADGDGPGDWLADLAAAASVEATAPVDAAAVGYLAGGELIADDLEAMARLAEAEVAYPDGALRFRGAPRTYSIPPEMLAARDVVAERTAGLGARPGSLTLDYLDPDRDYQAGRQRVARGRSGPALGASAPVVATAAQARAMASRWLKRAESAAESIELTLGWAWLDVTVGDIVQVSGRPERWRVVRRDVRGLLISLVAEMVPSGGALLSVVSDGGRALPAPVVPVPPTRIIAFEAPFPLRPGPPSLWVSANGAAGWRGAEVRTLRGGDEASLGLVAEAQPAGVLAAAVGAGPPDLWDEANVLAVAVAPGTPMFESRTASAVLGGSNLVLVGAELIQFRDAIPGADGIARLSGLLRGRFGTGSGAGGHAVGTPVELIRPDLLLRLDATSGMIGSDVGLLAAGRGDAAGGVARDFALEGLGLGALAPVHLRAQRASDGGIVSTWVPRGRDSVEWGAAEPAPGMFQWRYDVSGETVMTRTLVGSELVVSPGEQVAVTGVILPPGQVVVVAVGEGPEALRRSAHVPVGGLVAPA